MDNITLSETQGISLGMDRDNPGTVEVRCRPQDLRNTSMVPLKGTLKEQDATIAPTEDYPDTIVGFPNAPQA